jgi:RNA polymerase sigma factor (sigma-70 family)
VTFDSGLAGGSSDASAVDAEASLEERLALKDEIAKALERLPENHVTALMLVEGQGMSHKEAAQAMGLSPNSIAMYVSQARAALKLELDAQRSSKGTRR